MGTLMTPVFFWGGILGWKAPTKKLRLLKTFVILDFVEISFPTKHIPQNWQLRWVQSLWTGHSQSNLNKKIITNLHQLSNLKIHRIFGKKDQINQRRLVRKRPSKNNILSSKNNPPYYHQPTSQVSKIWTQIHKIPTLMEKCRFDLPFGPNKTRSPS